MDKRIIVAAFLLIGTIGMLFPNLSKYMPLTEEQSWVPHFLFFFVAMVLLKDWMGAKKSLMGLIALAAIAELLQFYIPGRLPTRMDFLAGLFGIIVAYYFGGRIKTTLSYFNNHFKKVKN
ncbi:MAG TPA: hypothetical protein VJH90_02000 [archaeon]|nr:hypothetical protein [archaeon]